jgi:microsomal dipeptidase-like Zn-dependent dipeptidase
MSNNLFDEEIKEVYSTGGIIGITMEERALGWGGYNYKINPATVDALSNYFEKNYAGSLNGKARQKLKKDLQVAEPFVRNLFYIVENSGKFESDVVNGTTKSWEHVAIGSDFDGVMNPIDICPASSYIPEFYEFLRQNLAWYASYMGKTNLLLSKSPSELLDRVFYLNGETFIKRHF